MVQWKLCVHGLFSCDNYKNYDITLQLSDLHAGSWQYNDENVLMCLGETSQ